MTVKNIAQQLTEMKDAVRQALMDAEKAYQFSPGSYTYSALREIMRAATIIGIDDDEREASQE